MGIEITNFYVRELKDALKDCVSQAQGCTFFGLKEVWLEIRDNTLTATYVYKHTDTENYNIKPHQIDLDEIAECLRDMPRDIPVNVVFD